MSYSPIVNPMPVTLTSTTITSGTVAVTGTFWQATQPVSGTITANIGTIAGLATEVTVAAMNAKMAALGQTTMSGSMPVVIASDQGALPVSGTFWQATQPVSIAGTVAVSGPLTDAQLRAVAVPVSGTFWQVTQPVSLTSTTITGTVAVTQPTLTKGTQGATGVSTQDLKDSGRNSRTFMLDVYTAAPAAEALQTVVQWYSGAAVAGTTTPAVVPAGKTLRLTSWCLSTKSLATVGSAVLRIRLNTGGTVVIGSPLIWSMEVGSRAGATTVAMTGGLDQQTGVFPEGFEIPAGAGIGFTLAGYGPTGTAALQGVTRFQVYGYEY